MKVRKDKLTPAQRSYCMSRVRGKNTSLEKTAFAVMRRNGVRFRKHVADLPGKPDIVIPEKKVALFLDGDFWHGYRFPAWRDSLSPFWRKKIESNIKRDRRNFARLRRSGWRVIRLWQHQVKRDESSITRSLEAALR